MGPLNDENKSQFDEKNKSQKKIEKSIKNVSNV